MSPRSETLGELLPVLSLLVGVGASIVGGMILPGSEYFVAFGYGFLAYVLLVTSVLLLASAFGFIETRESCRILQELYDEATRRNDQLEDRLLDYQVAAVLSGADSPISEDD